MVFWIRLAMVPWFGGPHSFPAPIEITMSVLLFETSPYPLF